MGTAMHGLLAFRCIGCVDRQTANSGHEDRRFHNTVSVWEKTWITLQELETM